MVFSELKDLDKMRAFLFEHRMRMGDPRHRDQTEYQKIVEQELVDFIKKQSEQVDKKKTTPGLEIPIIKEAMTASTLQSIGAGDVSSIMAGTYQASMLSAMQQTADNTQRIATQGEQQQTNPPPAVAR